MNSQIRDTNRTPNHLKAKISSPRYIVLKPSKINVKKFGKKDCNLQKEPHYVIIRFFFFFHQRPYQPGESGMKYSKY